MNLLFEMAAELINYDGMVQWHIAQLEDKQGVETKEETSTTTSSTSETEGK